METAIPFDLQRLFVGSAPPLFVLEVVVRVTLVYGFAVFALRFMGKRGRPQLSPLDSVVIIALGSATGDAMLYPEVPILYAWLIVVVIVALENLLAASQVRFPRMRSFVDGDTSVLIRRGEVLPDALARERLSREELMSMLRAQQVEDLGTVRYGLLEPTGKLAVVLEPPGPTPPPGRSTLEDLELG